MGKIVWNGALRGVTILAVKGPTNFRNGHFPSLFKHMLHGEVGYRIFWAIQISARKKNWVPIPKKKNCRHQSERSRQIQRLVLNFFLFNYGPLWYSIFLSLTITNSSIYSRIIVSFFILQKNCHNHIGYIGSRNMCPH